ncbi:hypothetical protein FXW78_51115 [Rhodococcus opacus]|nr:hypothetical protein [Rhodococcus opacus]
MQKNTPQVLPGQARRSRRAGHLTTDDVAGVVEALTGERVTPRPAPGPAHRPGGRNPPETRAAAPSGRRERRRAR